MVLNGSYPISLFAGDVDLYERVSMDELQDVLNQLIEVILKNDFLNVHEMKIGDTKLKSVKTIANALSNVDYVRKQLNKGKNKWLKVDFLPLSNGYVEDVTVIYDFGMMKPSDVITSIKDSLNDLLKKKDYFKALKRMKSLYKITGNNLLPQINNFLDDPKIGFTYLTTSRMNALKEADISREQKAEVLGNINEDVLIKLNAMYESPVRESIIYNKDLARVKNKLLKLLNDESYNFISSISQ